MTVNKSTTAQSSVGQPRRSEPIPTIAAGKHNRRGSSHLRSSASCSSAVKVVWDTAHPPNQTDFTGRIQFGTEEGKRKRCIPAKDRMKWAIQPEKGRSPKSQETSHHAAWRINATPLRRGSLRWFL